MIRLLIAMERMDRRIGDGRLERNEGEALISNRMQAHEALDIVLDAMEVKDPIMVKAPTS